MELRKRDIAKGKKQIPRRVGMALEASNVLMVGLDEQYPPNTVRLRIANSIALRKIDL